jgi:hypothetical protein
MMRNRLLDMSERWFRLLQRFYPPDFRDEMGNAGVEAYMDRARDTLARGGKFHLLALWLRALADSLRNGPAERARPAASWRPPSPRNRAMDSFSAKMAAEFTLKRKLSAV